MSTSARRKFLLAALTFLVTLPVTLSGNLWAAPKSDKPVAKSDAKPAKLLDLNKATEDQLQELPGIGPAYAKKIVAGRPYASVKDLEKTGLPAKSLEKIQPLVTVKTAAKAATPAPTETAAVKPAEKATTPAATVDLNTATAAQLQELPGVGEATAKKIIAGRPYGSAKDLAKVGIPASRLQKIQPLVTVAAPSATAATTTTTSTPSATATSTPSATTPTAPATEKSAARAKTTAKSGKPNEAVPARTPPQKGMVWVNTDSKVYHKEGDRWYGKTKDGKFMTEDEATKEGYRPAKPGATGK